MSLKVALYESEDAMTNILIVIDPEESNYTALERIKEIPATADVDYKVDLYFDAAPVTARKANSNSLREGIAAKQAAVDKLVTPYKEMGYRITTSVIQIHRLYEDIIKSARDYKADFVFKSVRQHAPLKRMFYTSTDWNLIRMCPTALLLVRDQGTVRGKPVIASVNIDDEDTEHQELNRIVLAQANALAEVLGAKVHLIYAYGPAVVMGDGADPMAYQIAKDKHDAEFKKAKALASANNVLASNTKLREGTPETIVTEYGEEISAGIIVLGTVARSGASGLFIGNTAESMLEKTHRDMFVIKLESFVSPV
ncbi:MAG: universal stress protein [Pseudomonadales bacterium]|nr:universal stress protein [Pseudomonadales bacterium]MDG1305521.1 universal stress protein [Pseudomonadales bacterium]|tara:strand:+ start:114 stop:1046 length:933 start_codon:yes stop_codon:yes gene_type:complete